MANRCMGKLAASEINYGSIEAWQTYASSQIKLLAPLAKPHHCVAKERANPDHEERYRQVASY